MPFAFLARSTIILNWRLQCSIIPSSYSLTPWLFSDPHSTPWLFIDPLDCPIEPWGSISATLRTTTLTDVEVHTRASPWLTDVGVLTRASPRLTDIGALTCALPWFNTVLVSVPSRSLLSLLNYLVGKTVMSLRQCAESADCFNTLIAWRRAPGCKTADVTHFCARCSLFRVMLHLYRWCNSLVN